MQPNNNQYDNQPPQPNEQDFQPAQPPRAPGWGQQSTNPYQQPGYNYDNQNNQPLQSPSIPQQSYINDAEPATVGQAKLPGEDDVIKKPVNKKLITALIVGVVILLLAAAGAVVYQQMQNEKARQTETARKAAEAEKLARLPKYPLNTDITAVSGPEWKEFTLPPEWVAGDKTGDILRFSSPNDGANLIAYQGYTGNTLISTTDKTRSEEYVRNKINELSAKTTGKNSSVKLTDSEGKTIELLTNTLLFDNEAGEKYKTGLIVRAMAGATLSLEYTAPVKAWNDDVWNNFKTKSEINGSFR